MAMQQSPYYTDPSWGQAGSSLATALFGNPELRAKQEQMRAEAELRRAQTEEATQHGRLYGFQGDGVHSQNVARDGLPGVMSSLFAPQMGPTPPPSPDDGAPIPQAVPIPRGEVFRAGLPKLAAAMLGSGQGGNDLANTIQALGAYADGDETARRGLVAGGHSPTADFALTPERADQIAANDAAAKRSQALGVANIAAGASRYGADRRFDGTKYSSDNSLRGTRYSADERGSTAITVAGMKPGAVGNTLAATVASLFPGAEITDGDRTQATQDEYVRRGWSTTHNSNHIPTPQHQGIDMRPLPGQTLGSVVAGLRAKGVTVIEAKDETSPGQGSAPHWHIATLPIPAAPKPGKSVSPSQMPNVERELGLVLGAELTGKPTINGAEFGPATRSLLKSRTADLYSSNGGNLPAAAQQAVREYRAARGGTDAHTPVSVLPFAPGRPITRAPSAKPAAKPAAAATRSPWPQYPNAKKAPDGNWYVQHGTKPDGSPQYAQIGE